MRIFFVTRDQGSWIDKDREILAREHQVTYQLLDKKYVVSFWKWISVLQKSDMVFAWFGSFYVLPFLILGRLFGKKVVLVAGGFDVAKAPEIQHGAFTQGLFSRIFRIFLFRWPHRVLTVSNSNTNEALKNAKLPKENIRLIPLGFDPIPKNVIPQPWNSRPKQVLMISSGLGSYYKIKGVDQFLALAKMMPNWEFKLMGPMDKEAMEKLNSEAPKNLNVLGAIPFRSSDFIQVVSDSRFILQLSYYESFGAAVVDAALFGCYPIVYKQFALPELVQDFGRSEKYGDLQAVKRDIEEVDKDGADCAAISKAFHLRFANRQREKGLLECCRI